MVTLLNSTPLFECYVAGFVVTTDNLNEKTRLTMRLIYMLKI